MARRGVLAIDIGTSSVRALVVGADGEPAGEGSKRSLEVTRTRGGASHADPERILALLEACVDEALAALAPEDELLGVAMCTFWHSICGIDADGAPTTPVLTWGDQRAAAAAAELRDELDPDAVHRRTGCVLHPSYVPAKLRWLAREQPGTVARTARWVSPGELVLHRLLGTARASTSMASGTGLFDRWSGDWDAELLEALALDPARLGELSDDPVHGLRPPWRERWPALARVPWFPAAGDGACSNLGAGAVDRSRAALMIGTSGALRIAWRGEPAEVSTGLWAYRAGPGLQLVGSALSNGGNLVAWLHDTLRLPPLEEAEHEIARMAPDAHGLTLLPLLAGERGPGWAGRARGAITGLTLATRPLDLLRAGLEAVALRFALVDELLAAAVAGDHELIGTGGGIANSSAWAGIIADALGRPLTPSLVDEASARGAALLALERLGEIPSVEAVPAPLGERIEPDAERHAAYRAALERQRALYEAAVR